MATWSYGITTVPSRRDLLKSTVASLQKAGFSNPYLFIDGSEGFPETVQLGLPWTLRDKAVGVVGNTILSLYELYHRRPTADWYALFQDDIVAVRNLLPYLEQQPVPGNGYGNLYTMHSNEPVIRGRSCGWYEAGTTNPDGSWQTGRGAQGLVFSNPALVTLLKQESLVMKPQGTYRPDRAVDGAIVTAMNIAGYREYIHNPSLLQHMGMISSMGNSRHPQAISFPGEGFDALSLITHAPRLG